MYLYFNIIFHNSQLKNKISKKKIQKLLTGINIDDRI